MILPNTVFCSNVWPGNRLERTSGPGEGRKIRLLSGETPFRPSQNEVANVNRPTTPPEAATGVIIRAGDRVRHRACNDKNNLVFHPSYPDASFTKSPQTLHFLARDNCGDLIGDIYLGSFTFSKETHSSEHQAPCPQPGAKGNHQGTDENLSRRAGEP